jgi:hypothetical protein
MLVPLSRIFLPKIWRWYVPPKRRFTQELHAATAQKTAFLLSSSLHFLIWHLICYDCLWGKPFLPTPFLLICSFVNFRHSYQYNSNNIIIIIITIVFSFRLDHCFFRLRTFQVSSSFCSISDSSNFTSHTISERTRVQFQIVVWAL